MPVGQIDTVGGDLPLPLGGGGVVGVPPSDVDVMVDRTPFWLAVSQDSPYQRATAQWQKDQADQQPEAGEQSLAGWWTRSQMSFHYGAGLAYLDTTARPQPEDRLRFQTSRNVDVWTPGKVSRLNGTTLARPTVTATKVWVEPTSSGWITATDSGVEVYDGISWTTRNISTAGTVKAFCTDGVNYYIATDNGVWTAPISGTATATKKFDVTGAGLPMLLGWVKQRLMFGHGPNMYALDTAGPTLPTAKMTHPVSGWTWSTLAEGPNGILAGGYAGLSSSVYRFTVEEVSGAPTLGAGVVLVTMPAGERVLSSMFYIGALLVLGTSRGIRVCAFNSYYGSVTLGPLTVTTEAPVSALGAYDRYVFGGTRVAGETSLVRVDLSAPIDDQGHYAWAPDLVFPDHATWTEAPTSIAFGLDGHKAVGVTLRGLVLESADTDATEAAWLQTSRIRMGTVEDKYFSYATLRGNYGTSAPIGVSVNSPTDPATWASVYVATVSSERFTLRTAPQEWVALRFDFSEGAELGSYQVQALPAGRRQRLLSIPLRVSNYESTRSGVAVGYAGWGLDRLAAVEHLDELGAEITVSAPALFPEAVRCVIERLEFTQLTDVGDAMAGTHGVLTLVLRTTA